MPRQLSKRRESSHSHGREASHPLRKGTPAAHGRKYLCVAGGRGAEPARPWLRLGPLGIPKSHDATAGDLCARPQTARGRSPLVRQCEAAVVAAHYLMVAGAVRRRPPRAVSAMAILRDQLDRVEAAPPRRLAEPYIWVHLDPWRAKTRLPSRVRAAVSPLRPRLRRDFGRDFAVS